MKSERIYILYLVTMLALALLFLPHAVFACSCPEMFTPPCAAFQRANLVFIGTVTDVSGPVARGDVVPHAFARFAIESVYKGSPGKEVIVDTAISECYPKLEANQQYFVYADSGSLGKLELSRCGRTRPLTAAGPDLEYVKSLAVMQPQIFVMGAIPSLSGNDLKEVTVTATGEHGSVESDITDGTFFKVHITDPGTYSIRINFPFKAKVVTSPDMTVKNSFGTVVEYAVDAQVGNCGYRELNVIRIDDAATVSGALVDNGGKPIPELLLHLYRYSPSQDFRTLQEKLARTDSTGKYIFKGISEGRYILGINLEGTPDLNTPYPKTFYPGVPNLNPASVINVQKDQHIRLDLFQLPPKLVQRQITGRLLWEDGTPVTRPSTAPQGLVQAILYLLSPDNFQKLVSLNSKEIDENGNFKLVGYAGYSYVIHSHAFKDKPFHSRHVKFTMTNSHVPLNLILSEPGTGDDQVTIRKELMHGVEQN